MDLIVLKERGKGNPLSASDIRALVYKGFHILIALGTVYSLLYSMERNSKKRVYRLTEKGRERLENISEINDKILSFIETALGKIYVVTEAMSLKIS